MKNLLLLTILLGTIACNGSGGGPLKVDPQTKQIIQEVEYYYFSDGEGFVFDIPCEKFESDTLLRICVPTTITNDIRAFEGINYFKTTGNNVYIGLDLGISSEEGEVLFNGVNNYTGATYTLTFKDNGEIGGDYYDENSLWQWVIKDERIIVYKGDAIPTGFEFNAFTRMVLEL